MELKEHRSETAVSVEITGRLDTTNYTMLDSRLNTLVDSGNTKIILDCGHMDYISSTGLRILLVALKRI